MRTVGSARTSYVGVGIVILWVASAGLASRLTAPSNFGDAVDDQSVLSRIFGSSREVISKQLFAEADRYFHKGVSRIPNRAFENHLFIRWGDAITPMGHDELEGDDIAEMMPWLRLAATSDPRNIDSYSTIAYWLAKQGDLDMARTVLEEARSKNPDDYRVPLSLGKLSYQNEDLIQALKEMEQARSLWPSGAEKEEEQTQLDLASILVFRAGSFEALGRQKEAIASFRELLCAFPNRHEIRRRLEELEKGNADIDRAEIFWEGLISEIEKQGRGASHLSGGAESSGRDEHADCHDHSHDHAHER